MGNCISFKDIYNNVFSTTKTPKTRTPKTRAPETKTHPETKAPETKTQETKTQETKAPETKTPETKTRVQIINEISRNNRDSNYSANVFPNIYNLPQKLTKKPKMLINFLRLWIDEKDVYNLIDIDRAIHNPNKIYTLNDLNEYCLEYRNISKLFMDTNKRCYNIQKIEKVFNPYLLLQYKLKYLEYAAKKKNVIEHMMFHGTQKTNLDNICRNNFNWRLSGRNSGSRNGKGVNFVNNAYYCTHYGDTGFNKVMILAKVLISECCQGSPTLTVPPGDIDTTTDHRQPPQVFVKFDDNSFYPAFIIYYGGIDPKYKLRT